MNIFKFIKSIGNFFTKKYPEKYSDYLEVKKLANGKFILWESNRLSFGNFGAFDLKSKRPIDFFKWEPDSVFWSECQGSRKQIHKMALKVLAQESIRYPNLIKRKKRLG